MVDNDGIVDAESVWPGGDGMMANARPSVRCSSMKVAYEQKRLGLRVGEGRASGGDSIGAGCNGGSGSLDDSNKS